MDPRPDWPQCEYYTSRVDLLDSVVKFFRCERPVVAGFDGPLYFFVPVEGDGATRVFVCTEHADVLEGRHAPQKS